MTVLLMRRILSQRRARASPAGRGWRWLSAPATRVVEVTLSTGTSTRAVVSARNAVLATFFLNGFAFATWASRIPSVRHALDLGPGRLGLLLLASSIGAVISLPTAGGNVQRFGARRVVIAATLVEAVGLL